MYKKIIGAGFFCAGLTLSCGAENAAGNSSYQGLGLASVTPEILQRHAPKPLPAELSAKIQNMMDVMAPSPGLLSPDGKTLFFSWRISGTSQIWRLNGPMQFPQQLTGGQDATSINDITPDGKYLIVSRDRNGEENPGLYLLPAQGGALQVLQHKRGVQTHFQFISDDGRWIYFRANDKAADSYALYRYDLTTKTIAEVFTEAGIWNIADHRDGRLLLAKEVGSNMAEYFELDEKKSALTPLFGQGEREDYSAAYGRLAGDILVLTPHFGEYRRLYLWQQGKFKPVSAQANFDVSEFDIDRTRSRITYSMNERGYTRAHALDAKTWSELKLPALPVNDHAYFGSSTHNGQQTVIGIDTGTAPLQSYVLDWKTLKLTRWHQGSAPEIDLQSFVPTKLETYPARDGSAIPAFVREPASCDAACPVIVVFHGGPESQARPGFSAVAQLYVDAGFVLVEPNVRGSDGYGKTWLHADDAAKRLNVITDIEDAAVWARQRFAKNGVTPKVGIRGGSYGGYSTLMGMTMFAGAYDAGVEEVGISNLLTFLNNTAPYRRSLRISEYGDPEKDRDALTQLSPTTYVQKLKAPLLLIQGANDPRVPVGEALQFFEVMKTRGVDGDMLIFADEGHGAAKRENRVYSIAYTLRFFQKHLQGKDS